VATPAAEAIINLKAQIVVTFFNYFRVNSHDNGTLSLPQPLQGTLNITSFNGFNERAMSQKTEFEYCPFCGDAIMGNPWSLKQHVQHRHRHRLREFFPHLNVRIRKWTQRVSL
jgi:hypothetical protein